MTSSPAARKSRQATTERWIWTIGFLFATGISTARLFSLLLYHTLSWWKQIFNSSKDKSDQEASHDAQESLSGLFVSTERRENWLRHTQVASGACSEGSPVLPLKAQREQLWSHTLCSIWAGLVLHRQGGPLPRDSECSIPATFELGKHYTEWVWDNRWTEVNWLQQRAVIHKCWHSPPCTALTHNTEAYPQLFLASSTCTPRFIFYVKPYAIGEYVSMHMHTAWSRADADIVNAWMFTFKNINSGCFLSFLWQPYLIQLVCSPPYLLKVKSFKILLHKALTYILTIGKDLWHFREQISIFSSPVPLLLWKAESWMLLKGKMEGEGSCRWKTA